MRDPNERWNLRFSLTAVRPPAPGVIAVGALALALLIGTIAGLEDSTSGLPVWTRLWRWYVADFVTAAVVTLGVAGLRKATPDRWYLDPPRTRAFAISYVTYLGVGVFGGLARYLMSQAVDVPPFDASATHHAARAGAIAAGMLLLGFVANQYSAFIDSIRAQERALRQRIADLNRENRERIETERAATMKEERLAAMLRTMDEGVVLADREQRVVLLNPAAERIVGRSNKEAAGRPLAEVLPRLVGLDAGNLLVRRPDGFPHEVEIEGASRFLEAAVAPIAEGPEIGGRLLLIRDVTDKKLAEQRAGQEERLVSLGKLSAGIAHDFNNLLTAIIGASEALEVRDDLSRPARNLVGLINEGGLRASRLVQQIMDFSRQRPVEMEPVDLVTVVVKFQEMLRHTIPENVQIHLDIGSDQLIVHGNARQIERVLMNLAVNAGQAMPEGGEFRVKLSIWTPGLDSRPPVAGMAPGDWIRMEVSDTGLGIPPENLGKIFDPFFTTKAPSMGTGLGLAQVHGIVRQHGGVVTVTSRLGIGTTFTVFLPALPRQMDAPSRPPPQRVPRGRGETILLVEDDRRVLEVVQLMLERLGYRVLTATDGREALQAYEQHQREIAVVVTDITMPVMGGFELYRTLRERNPDVKLIALTGHAFDEETRRYLASGMVDWLEKPPDTALLARTLRRVIEGEAGESSDQSEQAQGEARRGDSA